jgi:hypothetical protein
MKTYASYMFGTHNVSGGADAILGPSGCNKDVAKVDSGGMVYLDLEEHDERIAKVVALLQAAGKDISPSYWDEYTEEELQAAPLLWLFRWHNAGMWTGPRYGVTYDVSQACPRCLTGIRQASPLIVDGSEMLTANKHRVSSANYNNLLVRDTDVETLLAANVTGVNFWPVTAKYNSGATGEIRWQQALIDNILPPMSPSTRLVEEGKCLTCQRGRTSDNTHTPTRRVTYRRKDLQNICDFNLTWESFGPFDKYEQDTSGNDVLMHPRTSSWILVTPKVMNLLRGKTKKEQKYQGCGFAPIWIEDDTHDKPYLMT